MYDKKVSREAEYFTIKRFVDKQKQFVLYPEVLYVIDVLFRQFYRLCGIVEETISLFSGKYHSSSFKTEASVLPIGFAIGYSISYTGTIADVATFRANKIWHIE